MYRDTYSANIYPTYWVASNLQYDHNILHEWHHLQLWLDLFKALLTLAFLPWWNCLPARLHVLSLARAHSGQSLKDWRTTHPSSWQWLSTASSWKPKAAMVLNDRVLALTKQHPLVVLCCLKLCLITFKWTLATSSVFWQFVTVAFILVGVDKICIFFNPYPS